MTRILNAFASLARIQLFGVSMFALGGIYVALLIVGGSTTLLLVDKFL